MRTVVATIRTAIVASVVVAAILANATPTSAADASRMPVERVRMINYYPAGHGWTAMWTRWDDAEFDADMGRIAGLGANAVRLILQPQAFGYPTPASTMQAHLARAIDLANAHGLSVELTLFDWFSTWSDVQGSKQWASAVLAPYRNDTRVWAVELRNELPVNDPSAVSWASTMLPFLAALTASPTTVSVNGQPTQVATLKTRLGRARPAFWSYHYYDQVEATGASNAFAVAKAGASPQALYIGETGVDSYPRSGEDEAAAEARQDHFIRAIASAAAANGLPAPSPWILSDFVDGTLSSTTSTEQYHFGLLRTDGTAKPAAASTTAMFTGAAISTDVNGSFENGTSAVPAGWMLYLGTQATFTVDHSVAHSGTSSLRISQSLGSSTGWPSAWTGPIQACTPGRVYTATVWARGESLVGVNRIAISWYDGSGSYLGSTSSASVVAGTTGWQQLTARGAGPTGTAIARVYVQTTRNTGSVWFDDVTVS